MGNNEQKNINKFLEYKYSEDSPFVIVYDLDDKENQNYQGFRFIH